jgi:hypothetical protein
VDVTAQVEQIVRRAQEAGGTAGSQLSRVCAAFQELPDIDTSDPIVFRLKEYVIVPGLSMHLRKEAHILERVRGLALAAAPELVAMLPLAEGTEVLISRYWACPGEELDPVSSTDVPFRDSAVYRFRKDLERLARQGMMHPYVRGLAHWLVGRQTGTLVLNSWSALRPCDREEANDLLKRVDWLLSQRRR